MNHFAVLMQFLRDRDIFLENIKQGKKISKITFSLLVSSSFFFAIYGAIMGSFQGGLQILASAIKLPALYLLTLIICLPTLYFYEVVSGSKRTFPQYLAILLASMSIISVMLFGFAPVTLFFRLSINDYRFFTLLNVFFLSVTGLIGIRFLYDAMLSLATPNLKVKPDIFEDEEEAKEYVSQEISLSQQRTFVIRAWLILYAFVGSQLGWTLRPFFGAPSEPFALFRNLESNFYFHMFELVISMFGLGVR